MADGLRKEWKSSFLKIKSADPLDICQLQNYKNPLHFDIKYHLKSERGGCVICESDLIYNILMVVTSLIKC